MTSRKHSGPRRPDTNRFIVAGESGLKALPYWLQRRNEFNQYGIHPHDRCTRYSLTRVDDPGADWAKVRDRCGQIVVTKTEHDEAVETCIRTELRRRGFDYVPKPSQAEEASS